MHLISGYTNEENVSPVPTLMMDLSPGRAGHREFSPFCDRMLKTSSCGDFLWRSCVGNHSCCEFKSITVPTFHLPTLLPRIFFCLFSPDMFCENWRGAVDVTFMGSNSRLFSVCRAMTSLCSYTDHCQRKFLQPKRTEALFCGQNQLFRSSLDKHIICIYPAIAIASPPGLMTSTTTSFKEPLKKSGHGSTHL